MSFELIGIGTVPTNISQDFTNANMAREYKKHMETIQRIFEKTELTDKDAEDLQKAMQGLYQLARAGLPGSDPSDPRYMTTGMLDGINTTTLILQSVGISPPDFKCTKAQVETLRNTKVGTSKVTGRTLYFPGFITEVINTQVSGATMSLSAMIQYQFIPDTFEMFAAILDALRKRMNNTKKIEDTTASIMEIANMITPAKPSGFKPVPDNAYDIPKELVDEIAKYMNGQEEGSGTAFKNAYAADVAKALELYNKDRFSYPTFEEALKKQTKSSDLLRTFLNPSDNNKAKTRGEGITNIYDKYFDQLIPTPNPTENAAYELLDLRNQLKQALEELEKLVRDSDPEPKNPIPPRDRINSMAYYMNEVIKDIDNAFEGVQITGDPIADKKQLDAAVKRWILDNQDQAPGSENRGKIKNNLNQLISLVTSMNNELKTEFQSETSLFQTFIEIAQRILDAIQNIRKGFWTNIRAS